MNDGTPGGHLHADRRNWRPASTIEEYLENCRAGLEAYSDRRAAKLMGHSRTAVWRTKLIAELPSDLFDRLIEQERPPSIRELASIARALRGDPVPMEVERCPHCSEVLRERSRWSAGSAAIVEAWQAE